ncbi:energy transducer TonB [Chitinispirillales bacterium ANBcel5]|uniref:energy transducer TonB n=1 Tax=Cellulosispirillum alkaliphilum TaxID=3039283 RepID=UPI002A58F6E6|nr:energy transducer TonB [Chitinispirillales bacterium ANBcel5]
MKLSSDDLKSKDKPVIVDHLFTAVLVIVMLLFAKLGLSFRGIEPPEQKSSPEHREIVTQFMVEEQKPQPPPVEEQPVKEEKPKEPEKKEEKPPEIIDLTEPVPEESVEETEPQKEKEKEETRPVYGLNRVYSKGIGEEGSMSDAVVGRLGNTLNTDVVDSVTATPQDLKGRVVSAATVSKPPRFKRQVRPRYTREMIENEVEGVIRIRVLVDIDGKVKEATLLNDLGYDSGEQALEAIKKFEFHPAIRDDEPVAVWIIVPVRFVLLS